MGSEQNSGRRSRRRAAADCRQGNHRYGVPQLIGGGMYRQTCAVCAAVSIDIRHADDTVDRGSTPSRRGSHGR